MNKKTKKNCNERPTEIPESQVWIKWSRQRSTHYWLQEIESIYLSFLLFRSTCAIHKNTVINKSYKLFFSLSNISNFISFVHVYVLSSFNMLSDTVYRISREVFKTGFQYTYANIKILTQVIVRTFHSIVLKVSTLFYISYLRR